MTPPDLRAGAVLPPAQTRLPRAGAVRTDPVSGGAATLVPGVGDTPLFELRTLGSGLAPGVRLFAKGEHLNPGGSVKDRAADAMIRAGIRDGRLGADRVLIDATSGNTGIAYAMIGARVGFEVELALPANASRERLAILRSYGARLILTDPLEGTDGAQHEVQRRVESEPDRYFHPDQYNNEENWKAHFVGTGPEILRQTGGRVTHFVAGLGTTGTFGGVARRLHMQDPGIRCLSLQPDSPMHGLEGMKHLATAKVPGIHDPSLADGELTVDSDEAIAMTRRLAAEEGLLVGPSSGANVAAALRLAGSLEAGLVVTILCDSGTRYLSAPFWTA